MLLNKFKLNGNRTLIFSQFTTMLDIIEDYLDWKGYNFLRLDGSTSLKERDEIMRLFQAPGSTIDIFILSTRAGGLGITLNTADRVILYDSDWNPQMDLQAMDRAHRIGQTKQVIVYRLITEDSVEVRIAEKSACKLKLDHLVIQKGRLAQGSKAIDKNEVSDWIQFGAQKILQAGEEGMATEKDIDKILEISEEKSKVITDKIKTLEEKFNLQNFTNVPTVNCYEFEEQIFPRKK